MKEIWKQYKDTSYYVSSFGNVYNKKTGKILAPEDTGYGYYCVGLYLKDGYKKTRVHRMVAETFIPMANDGIERLEVDHLNGDKSDNTVGNLRWATHKENMNNPFTKRRISDGVNRRYGNYI